MSAALADAVRAVFSDQGPLARDDAAYRRRQAQEDMAIAVAEAIESRGTLVVEAGTGVGKTYAYLVPLLMSGARALISTATKGLQDQLFHRDLPRLLDRLGLPTSVALLKGRASYLCPQRLSQARQSATPLDRGELRALARVEAWAATTTRGDLAELDGLDERSPILPRITSTRDNCLGSECPRLAECPVVRARREAMAADVVVINHHLYFADAALRDTGVAELLPSVEALVFDEAHQLGEAGLSFLGRSLGTAQLQDLARDLATVGLQQARGLQPWPELAGGLERAGRELLLALGAPAPEGRAGSRLRWSDRISDRPEAARTPQEVAFRASLDGVGAAVAAAHAALVAVQGAHADLDRLLERAEGLRASAQAFGLPAAGDRIRWIETGARHVRLVESPLDIREALSEQRQRQPRAWVFASATLGDDAQLSWFTAGAGLDDARTLRLNSPFDYANHARLWVPSELPLPKDPGHTRAVALVAARCAEVLGGRTFLLATTTRALGAAAEVLRERWQRLGVPVEVLVQGEAPKRVLLERFVSAGHAAGGGGALLVGTHSFWEGIDVPGDALQCVVIDKLPFPPPDDPVVEARSLRERREGRDPFKTCLLAEAAVALKQGAGRLIRSESDRGLLVIGDRRLLDHAYGARLISALPPMGRLGEAAEVKAYLESIVVSPA